MTHSRMLRPRSSRGGMSKECLNLTLRYSTYSLRLRELKIALTGLAPKEFAQCLRIFRAMFLLFGSRRIMESLQGDRRPSRLYFRVVRGQGSDTGRTPRHRWIRDR